MSAKTFGSQLIQSHISYKEHMVNNNPLFNQRMKRIIYKNFTAIEDIGIFEQKSTPTPNLFFFHADRYNPNLRQELEDYIVQEIDHFHNNYDTTYAVVYAHSSIFDFIAFRKMLQKWPEHFFYRLRRVYILGPSFLVRLVQTFSIGTFYRLCDEIFLNIDSEEALAEHDTDLLKKIGEPSSPFKAPAYKESLKIISNELYGKKLDQYDLSYGRYPNIILELFRRLLRDPTELRAQGIFRKNCDSDELERLQKQIIGNQQNAIANQEDIFVACGCLKKILNNLSLPLFNYAIYAKVINFQSGDELAFIKELVPQMEFVNRSLFTLMVAFLSDYIISQKQFNKMSAYNIAVVFGPCFFRPKEYDLKDLIYSGKFAKVLITFLEKEAELIEPAERTFARETLQQLAKQPKAQ